MSGAFIFLWLLSSVAFWITLIFWIINIVKKRKGKITGKVPAILFILTTITFIFSALTINPTSTSSNNDNTNTSSETAKKDSNKKLKSSTSSSEKYSSNSLDYSKVEYGMTMDDVINAVSSQPTEKEDDTLFFDKDEFDFVDNKLVGSNVKTVQNKIDAKVKAAQKEIDAKVKSEKKSERKQNKKQKEQKFTDEINAKINEINQATQESNGIDAILGVNGPNENNVYRVQLDDFILNGNDFQIKSAINSIHSQFIDILESNGKRNHIIYYYVGGTEIAKSKILNSSEVKLEK
ncbi:hypothetical protein [Weissella hellenica]|uniref:hypothetical protein n=1 Tax=Weissella hellenica TaxID=46256 RepID=UPI00388567D0